EDGVPVARLPVRRRRPPRDRRRGPGGLRQRVHAERDPRGRAARLAARGALRHRSRGAAAAEAVDPAAAPARRAQGRPAGARLHVSSGFARAAILNYGTSLAASVLSLGNVLIIARGLDATGRGEIAFLTTIVVISSALGTLGIPQAASNFA